MPEAVIKSTCSGVISLSGDLVLAHVAGLLVQCESLFKGQKSVVIDLQDVADVDSSGLALLLELVDRAKAGGVDLTFNSLSADMMNIARLSNVESLLPLSN